MTDRKDVIAHLQIIWTWARVGDIRRAEMPKICQWTEDAIRLLEQAPVRCGDCRHRLSCLISGGHDGSLDWFCADGEREEQGRMEL